MNTATIDKELLVDICVNRCGGQCCNPWWGVIFYTLKKTGGFDGLSVFKKKVALSIKERADRIKGQYITNEKPPRALFGDPEKYNVSLQKIRVVNAVLHFDLRAMFAFRCRFLTEDNKCGIHPEELVKDIRPPHCAFLGTPDKRAGEKGFCRIITTAVESGADDEEIAKAIEAERVASRTHLDECVSTVEAAAGGVIEQIKAHIEKSAKVKDNLEVKVEKTPGRNDPCPCGSGKKFKKCHG